MRALAFACVIALWGLASAAELRTTATGFDHASHGRAVAAKGAAEPACAHCHEAKGKLVARPGHAACFGACHGAPPKAPRRNAKLDAGDRTKVCSACHAESALAAPYTGKLPTTAPPPEGAHDFGARFGHQRHATIACTQCHDMRSGAKPPRVHDRCAGCHDGSGQTGRGPAMSTCATCHPATTATDARPAAARTDALTTAFSHPTHAGLGPLGKDCAKCHAGARTTDEAVLPHPTMQSCATGGCHDGKAAFATTNACTRCHTKAAVRYEVARPTSRFLHVGFHAEVVAKRPCGACHALGSRGDTLVASHDACVECHAKDFAARVPQICGACHNATEPWRALVADRGPPDRTEFGASLDHGKHTQPCAQCHVLRTQTAQLRPPRGHASCTGAGCHAAKSGPAPTLETCDGCHRAGLAAARNDARLHAPWSVRAAFDHATHATDDAHQPIACTSCHTSLAGADLVALPSPAKATCAPCHDAGKTAFKLTGTTCSRCHRERAP